jgi:hypothetical protein
MHGEREREEDERNVRVNGSEILLTQILQVLTKFADHSAIEVVAHHSVSARCNELIERHRLHKVLHESLRHASQIKVKTKKMGRIQWRANRRAYCIF